MQAYCLKCRARRDMRKAQKVTLKNGRPATQGTCPVCGTKMYRIGGGSGGGGKSSGEGKWRRA